MPEQENNNLESIIKIAQSTIGLMSPLAKEISKHLIKRLVRRPFTLPVKMTLSIFMVK